MSSCDTQSPKAPSATKQQLRRVSPGYTGEAKCLPRPFCLWKRRKPDPLTH